MTNDLANREDGVNHYTSGGSDTEAGVLEESQAATAINNDRHLTGDLMSKICLINNLRQAYKRVKRNKGSAGVDGMTIDEMHNYFKTHIEELRHQLLSGTYHPQPVRGVKIPKPGGGERQLGIPTIVDRVIQQAIAQVLEEMYEPTFSNSSYGFRRNRGAHDALKQASAYVKEGREWVHYSILCVFEITINNKVV